MKLTRRDLLKTILVAPVASAIPQNKVYPALAVEKLRQAWTAQFTGYTIDNQLVLNVHSCSKMVQVSMDLLRDSVVDIGSRVGSELHFEGAEHDWVD